MPLFSLLLDLGVRLPGLLGQSSSRKPQILTAVTLVESSKRWKYQAQRQCMLWHVVKLITRPRLKPLNSKYRRQRKPLSELRATTLQKFSAHHKSPFQYMLQLGRRWKYKVEMSSETTEPVPLHKVINNVQVIFTHSNDVAAIYTWHHLVCNNDECWQALNFKCAEFWCNSLTLRGHLSKRFSLPYHSISSHIMLIDVEYIF